LSTTITQILVPAKLASMSMSTHAIARRGRCDEITVVSGRFGKTNATAGPVIFLVAAE
jgi:hypothetical protein